MDTLQAVTLLAAALATGLMAGVFWLYGHTIMPGLGRTDDRTFVGAFQAIDRAIINPVFMAAFFGAPVLTALAGALQLGDDGGSVLPWIVAALILYLVLVAITLTVNVPKNDEIKAAGDPDSIDVAAVRRGFDEPRWIRVNRVRVLLNLVAFGCLLWALVEYGRA